jgi:queuine/archaeosine tRNA-ribosyltransferase
MKENISYIRDILTLLEEHADDVEKALTESGEWAEFSEKMGEASDNLVALCMQYETIVELLKQAEEESKLRGPRPLPPPPSPGEIGGRR